MSASSHQYLVKDVRVLHLRLGVAMHGVAATTPSLGEVALSKKLSKVQREVLEYMARGHKLYASSDHNWLDEVPGERGLCKRVHGNTLYALRRRGYISRDDTARTPWWRRDYEITTEGRKCLTNAV